MGYVDDQVQKYRRQYADAVAGKRVRESIRQLQDRAQVKDSLKALPARGAIVAKRKVAKRVETSAGGIASPLTEIAGLRQYHAEEHTVLSSDGLFSIKYRALKTMFFSDANGESVAVAYDDPPLV